MEQHTPYFTAVIADDEPSIRNGLKEAIPWEENYLSIVGLANDGRRALQLIAEHHPDLAIVDIRMPQMSGLDVIREAREAGEKTEFIILSGYNDFFYAKEAIRYGAKAYLLKPLDKEELLDEIRRILGERIRLRPDTAFAEEAVIANTNTNFFRQLIDSKVLDSGRIGQVLVTSHIRLSDASAYVLVLLYDQLNAASGERSSILSASLSFLEKQFAEVRHIFWQYDDQKIIGIFNSSQTTSFQTAMECLEVLDAAALPSPVIGVGDTVPGLFECSYSYNRALNALSYRLYDDSSRIFTSQLICTVPPKLTLSDIDYLPLVQFIVKKDLEGIRRYCNEFVSSLLYVKMPPPNYVFSLCYALFNLITQEFSSFSQEDIKESANANDLYQFRKLTQIRQWLIDSFCWLSEYIDAVYGYSGKGHTDALGSSDLSGSADSIIRSAKEFIHEQIGNHIKIEDIAKQVHLSPSYFAIYFKNKTNVNLRDYLLAEKMDYARQRLSEPGAVISDIAYDVGYGDYRSFSRAFKNICGMTPSDYQSRYR